MEALQLWEQVLERLLFHARVSSVVRAVSGLQLLLHGLEAASAFISVAKGAWLGGQG